MVLDMRTLSTVDDEDGCGAVDGLFRTKTLSRDVFHPLYFCDAPPRSPNAAPLMAPFLLLLLLLYRRCSVSLDIIGKAIFNYDFGSVTKESPIIQSVYSVLKEAEHRSTTPAPYWQLPLANQVNRRRNSRVFTCLHRYWYVHMYAISKSI